MDDSWTRGPVVIVGASGTGRRRAPAPARRPAGRGPAIGRGDDLTHAARDADAVVHLAGAMAPRRPNTFEKANVGTVRATVRALQGSSVAARRVRLVPRREPGVVERVPPHQGRGRVDARRHRDPYHGVPLRPRHRTALGAGPDRHPFLARGDHAVAVLGTGRQRWTPVLREDVVEGVMHAALDPATLSGTFDLAGPDAITVDDLVDRVNGREVRKRHLHGAAAHVIAALLPSLHAATVEIMAADWVLDGAGTAAAFGITRHGLDTLWPRVGAPTSPSAQTRPTTRSTDDATTTADVG